MKVMRYDFIIRLRIDSWRSMKIIMKSFKRPINLLRQPPTLLTNTQDFLVLTLKRSVDAPHWWVLPVPETSPNKISGALTNFSFHNSFITSNDQGNNKKMTDFLTLHWSQLSWDILRGGSPPGRVCLPGSWEKGRRVACLLVLGDE